MLERQAAGLAAVEELDLTCIDSGGTHEDASLPIVEHFRIHELGERLPQRCGVIDARQRPRRREERSVEAVHAGVAEGGKRLVDLREKPEHG